MALADNLIFYSSPASVYPSGLSTGSPSGATDVLSSTSGDGANVWDCASGDYATTYTFPSKVLQVGSGDFSIAIRFNIASQPASAGGTLLCHGDRVGFSNYLTYKVTERVLRKVGLSETYTYGSSDECDAASFAYDSNYYTLIFVKSSGAVYWFDDAGTDITFTNSFWSGQGPDTGAYADQITLGCSFTSENTAGAFFTGLISFAAVWERAVDPSTETITRAAIEAALPGGGGASPSPIFENLYRHLLAGGR